MPRRFITQAILAALCCVLIVAAGCAGNEDGAQPRIEAFAGLWPKPQRQALSGDLLPLDLEALGRPGGVECVPRACGEALTRAIDRFKANALRCGYRAQPLSPRVAARPGGPALASISLHVGEQAGDPLGPGSFDESYQIQAPGPNGAVRIRAETEAGALAALETLSQLLVAARADAAAAAPATAVAEGTAAGPVPPGLWLLAANISDRPRFPHRGVRLAGPPPPASALRSLLGAMAASKLNVLRLTEPAAGDEELESLAACARLHGIRILTGPADSDRGRSLQDPTKSDSDPSSESDLDLESYASSLGLDSDEREEAAELLHAEAVARDFVAQRRLHFFSRFFGGGGSGSEGAAGATAAANGGEDDGDDDVYGGGGGGGGMGGAGGGGGMVRRRRRRRVGGGQGGGGAMMMRGQGGGGGMGGGGGVAGGGFGGGAEGPGGGSGGRMMKKRRRIKKMKKRKIVPGAGGAGRGGFGGGGGGYNGDDDGGAGGDLYRRRTLLGQRLRYYSKPDGRGGEAWEPFLTPAARGIGGGGGGGVAGATAAATAASKEDGAVVLSAGWCRGGGDGRASDADWLRTWSQEPLDWGGGEAENEMVAGAEVCLDLNMGLNLDPSWELRLAAAAERLWSDADEKDAAERLAVHMRRVAARETQGAL